MTSVPSPGEGRGWRGDGERFCERGKNKSGL